MSDLPIGKQISLPGHFEVSVTLEAARPLGKGFEIRVRLEQRLDQAKKEVVAARYFDIPADAIEQAAIKLTCN